MAVMKCKMCGGDLEITEGSNIAVCEYCGTKQTVPTLDNERKTSLFGRAGRLLRACEFDKASVVFGDIVSEFPEEAEAYWGLLLCKYGVEYVDDPATGKKIPTCHRLSFNSVMEDSDLEQALENADSAARSVYREEAKFLEELRRNVIEVSSKEEPYDVFICYKETDANGDRTIDSVMAQDIYDELTEKGLRVFFARITLEDKLGIEYEPYIFAALNSAKVMLAIGTDYEYFNAVWVKNEWSRFLKLIANGEKKVLIPCYKNIDAYDMPSEFKNLQAQDMGKLGFMQDLVRGVCKIVGEKKTVIKETIITTGKTNITPLLKRAFMFLEDGDFASADEYCEKVLDNDPECAEAYLGKLMVELKVQKREQLAAVAEPFANSGNYKKAERFADKNLRAELSGYLDEIKIRKENERFEKIYIQGIKTMKAARTENDFIQAAKYFDNVARYENSAELAEECRKKAEECRKNSVYENGIIYLKKNTVQGYLTAESFFNKIPDWRDSKEKITYCHERIEKLKKAEEKKKTEEIEKKEKNKKRLAVVIPAIGVIAVAVICFITLIQPMLNYNSAVSLMEEEKYEEALAEFKRLDGYKDSEEQVAKCEAKILERDYQKAVKLFEEENYAEAILLFAKFGEYKDTKKYLGKSEFFVKAEEAKKAFVTFDINAVEKKIKELEALPESGKQDSVMDECYFAAAKAAVEAKDDVFAEEIVGKIKNSDSIEGYAEFAQELEYLKIYNEAKAIEIKSNKTKNQVKELCGKLPEDYEGRVELLSAVAEYEKKQSESSGSGSGGGTGYATGNMSLIQGTWHSLESTNSGSWENDSNYTLVINGNRGTLYYKGEIFKYSDGSTVGENIKFDSYYGNYNFLLGSRRLSYTGYNNQIQLCIKAPSGKGNLYITFKR